MHPTPPSPSHAPTGPRGAPGAIARAAGAALLCVAFAAVPARAADDLKLSPAQVTALGIQTAAPRAGRSAKLEGLPAQVAVPNAQQRVVSAPLAGLVEQVRVATQEPVRSGQWLVRLQSPELADAQHTYLQAVTRLELERANLERNTALFDAGVIAERVLLASRAAHTEIVVDLAERVQALRLAGMSEAAIERLRAGRRVGTAIDLQSPIDGVIVEQLAVVGQRVDAAAPLLRVARLEPLWLEIQVPVARVGSVANGAAVEVPALGVGGRVIAVGRNVAADTQTALVRAEVGAGAGRLRPGQFVEVTLAIADGGQWELPQAAVARVGGRSVVFVRTPGGFRAQPVRVLNEGATHTLVAADLAPAERVAVRGVAALKAASLGIGVE